MIFDIIFSYSKSYGFKLLIFIAVMNDIWRGHISSYTSITVILVPSYLFFYFYVCLKQNRIFGYALIKHLIS